MPAHQQHACCAAAGHEIGCGCSGTFAVTDAYDRGTVCGQIGVRRGRARENSMAAYAVYVCTLKHSPPITYHGQDSARGG